MFVFTKYTLYFCISALQIQHSALQIILYIFAFQIPLEKVLIEDFLPVEDDTFLAV